RPATPDLYTLSLHDALPICQHVIQVAQAVQADVQHGDLRAQARRHLRCVGADDAAADDDHVVGLNAGHAAQQDTAALSRALKVLDRKSTRLNSSHVKISYAV